MLLVWEGWGYQNPHGENGSEPAPSNFPKMLWAHSMWGQQGRGNRHLLTAPHLAQGRLESMSWNTEPRGTQEDHGTAAGRRFPTPLHSWQFLLHRGPIACTKLSEIISNEGGRKGWFCSGLPALAIRGPIFSFSYPFQAVLFPHKSLQQLLLPPPLPHTRATQKDPGFGGGCFGIFLVCIKIPIYLCVYRHFSMLCTQSVCTQTHSSKLLSKRFTVKVLCLQMPRSPQWSQTLTHLLQFPLRDISFILEEIY